MYIPGSHDDLDVRLQLLGALMQETHCLSYTSKAVATMHTVSDYS